MALAHMLAELPLNWIRNSEDIPISISCETGGSGDDFAISTSQQPYTFEVQAKSGLTAGDQLATCIEKIFARVTDTSHLKTVIVTDGTKSLKKLRDFQRDLDRIESGRVDELSQTTRELASTLGISPNQLNRLSASFLTLNHDSDGDFKSLRLIVSNVLEDESKIDATLDALFRWANKACAKREAITRDDLIRKLSQRGIKLKPKNLDAATLHRLASVKELIDEYENDLAKRRLDKLRSLIEPDSTSVPVTVKYHLLEATVDYNLHNYHSAITAAMKVLGCSPGNGLAYRILAICHFAMGNNEAAVTFANKGISEANDSIDAWIGLTIVAPSSALFEMIPVHVAQSAKFMEAQLRMSFFMNNLQFGFELSEKLFKQGERTPDILYFRSRILVTELSAERSALEEAIQLIAELLSAIPTHHPLTIMSIALRGEAHWKLGNATQADNDIERALILDPESESVIAFAIETYIARNRYQQALSLLSATITDSSPILLALKARVLVDSDKGLALSCLNSAIAIIDADAYAGQASLKIKIAEIAWMLDESDLSKRILENCSELSPSEASHAKVLNARIAFSEGKVEDGRRLYGEVLNDIEDAGALTLEMISMLQKYSHTIEALEECEKEYMLGRKELVAQVFFELLMELKRYERANELLIEQSTIRGRREWIVHGLDRTGKLTLKNRSKMTA